MKSFWGKLVSIILGIIAVFGISTVGARAITVTPNAGNKSALYLEHGKSINGNSGMLNYQDDSSLNHVSHSSHSSHVSHSSHNSGY